MPYFMDISTQYFPSQGFPSDENNSCWQFQFPTQCIRGYRHQDYQHFPSVPAGLKKILLNREMKFSFLQVEFNEGFTFLLGEDWSSKSVEIALYDSSRSTYGSNPILGGSKIGMRDLVRTISIIDMFSFPDISSLGNQKIHSCRLTMIWSG